MITRELTCTEIEDVFGPLVEIAHLPDGGWDVAAITAARAARLLWTRVEPGLVSIGLHYVNRECYFRASQPHPANVDVCEVDDDISECAECGAWTYFGRDTLCEECERASHAT